MSGANPERGEHELALAGVKYRLRPSFDAVRAIEAKTEPLMILVQLANRFQLTLDQLGVVACEFIRAGAEENDHATKAVAPERLAELIYEEGATLVTARLTVCLADAASGGRKASGEAKAVAGS
jgi:hypothetical protein